MADPKTVRRHSTKLPSDADDRFQLLGTLGQGGMGKVLSYLDRGLDRRVAIKVALDKAEAGASEALAREASVLGTLFHPNIIPVYDIGEDDDWGTYYVMPLLAEPTFQDALRALREGKTSHGRLLRLFVQVCQAVAYAHSRGITHCDLKPENILLGSYGEVFVADWGFALRDGEKPKYRGGTAGFMPPEQLERGRQVDGRTDVFALGVMLYLLLTDQYPFPFIAFKEWDAAAAEGQSPFPPLVPPSARAADRRVPPELDEICTRALELDPDKRLTTARELVNALEAFIEGTKDKKRRAKRAAELCSEGRALAESYGDLLEAAEERAADLARLRAEVAPWSSAAEKEALWQAEDAAQIMSGLAAKTMQASVTALEHALDEVPDHAEAKSVLAALYRVEFERALGARDDAARRHYEALALEHDDGSFAAFLEQGGVLDLSFAGGELPESVRVSELGEEGPRLTATREVARATGAETLALPQGNYVAEAYRGHTLLASAPIRITPGVRRTLAFDLTETSEAWVHVPGGPALLGGHESNPHGDELQTVEVAAFAVMRFPVTVAEYFVFFAEEARGDRARAEALLPRDESGAALWIWDAETETPIPALAAKWGDPAALAVVGLDLAAARAYAAWASARAGRVLRLPRDDEWEKAARGVDGRRYPWGDRFDGALCKTRESRPGASLPEPVGAFPLDASPYGLRDAAGGVAEWVESTSEHTAAIRGGSWTDWSMACHLGARRTLSPVERSPSVGFRLVRPPAPQRG